MGCNASSFDTIFPKDQKKGRTSFKAIDTMRTPVDNGNHKFDPRIPLTVRQRFNILKSWKGIARNIETTGVNMFMRLFETNEEVRSMFEKIVQDGHYDIAQLRDSLELENHVKMVMYTLDEAISSLEDVDAVVTMLHAVGRSHMRLKASGFNPIVFWKIEEPFLSAVKETLGDRYSANMEHIYRKTIQFILETLIQGFRLEEKST